MGSVVLLGHKRKTVPLEHCFDGIHVRLAHSAKKEVHLTARNVQAHVLQQELRDDLVCAREVEQPDV
jgi:hypothetical protein